MPIQKKYVCEKTEKTIELCSTWFAETDEFLFNLRVQKNNDVTHFYLKREDLNELIQDLDKISQKLYLDQNNFIKATKVATKEIIKEVINGKR